MRWMQDPPSATRLRFPNELMMLFADLGVNYKRDAEIYHITQLESGLHQNGGWFHFIGSIVKQPIGPASLDHFIIDFVPRPRSCCQGF